jgi:hypothetical protein
MEAAATRLPFDEPRPTLDPIEAQTAILQMLVLLERQGHLTYDIARDSDVASEVLATGIVQAEGLNPDLVPALVALLRKGLVQMSFRVQCKGGFHKDKDLTDQAIEDLVTGKARLG